MITNQRTIKWKTQISGIGLHTGNHSTITFLPSAPNSGIKFIRTDLPGNPIVPSLIEYVVDISRGTTLQKEEAVVHTVEHVLAAVAGLQIDNLDIEINANEPPVGDGSAKPFVDVLTNAGFEEQNIAKDFLIVDETVNYKDEERGVEIVALPLNDYRITVMVDFKNPALGSQHTGLFSLEEEFIKEFAPARTFCFLKEVEMLADQGLIKGGTLESALVIVDEKLSEAELDRLQKKFGIKEKIVLGTNGMLNNVELRFENEPCRHKLLDVLGDLALVGAPIKAQILAARTGHKANIEFAKKLRKLYEKQKLTKKYQEAPKAGVVFDINAIKKILPHRFPFLMIDKIIELEMGKKIKGIKNVTSNEPFFEGHFPGHPIMPGVLIVEAMAQVGGIMLLSEAENPETKLVYFAGINNAKFKKPVLPGDTIVFELTMINRRRSVFKMKGEAYVEGKLVCEAELTAVIVDR
ncbi:bifunctional UDP-3-O-[3-hydroxymyristoyl] N-acetylglucosamine deacetylase/3-hydroxyacyl-ACP dehydratase [candidate division KSB1 bacterium]|nr:bifunctional UDP-3-O-[3-hydroxymyristoyl] N-acetylglucosamine deacetylase/3-hydroxyacyl-ACP dehydratase [candidate division KSB1 bacterium]